MVYFREDFREIFAKYYLTADNVLDVLANPCVGFIT